VRWGQVYNENMNVKVPNAMTMREVRDIVCEKRKVDPNLHRLEVNGKPLDLNLTGMTANLQQGAKIDLVKVAHESHGIWFYLFIYLFITMIIIIVFEENHGFLLFFCIFIIIINS
jgi:hypothetical protein